MSPPTAATGFPLTITIALLSPQLSLPPLSNLRYQQLNFDSGLVAWKSFGHGIVIFSQALISSQLVEQSHMFSPTFY
jgi:hypothetical protein